MKTSVKLTGLIAGAALMTLVGCDDDPSTPATPMTVAKMVANQRHQLFSPDSWIFKNMPDLWFHGFPFYKPVAKIEKP